MKRIIALLLAALLMVSCALADVALRGYDAKSGYVYVTLGQCPQDADGGVEPIVWRVLSVEDGRAYLLSEYVLEARPIHSDYQEYANKPTNKKKPGFNGDFTQTEMSRYLCGDFAQNCFTDDERAMLTPDDTFGLFFLASDAIWNKARLTIMKAAIYAHALANGCSRQPARRSPLWTRSRTDASNKSGRVGAHVHADEECGLRAIVLERERFQRHGPRMIPTLSPLSRRR
ncbi:MAG: hypothetical protein ACLT1X_09535 [Christensenellales bacterium]